MVKNKSLLMEEEKVDAFGTPLVGQWLRTHLPVQGT